jgi:hypothetical protein
MPVLRLRTLLLVAVFALLVCAPAWTKDFGTNVSGSVTTECYGIVSYDKPDNGSFTPKNTIAGRSTPCSKGSANSQSQAYLGISVKGYCKQDAAAGCTSDPITFDIATLKPPKGDHAQSVPIGYVDTYTITIGGVTYTTTADVKICWTIQPGNLSHCEHQSTNGTIAHTTTQDGINIPKPFIVTIFDLGIIKTSSEGPQPQNNGSVEAYVSDVGFRLILPRGWTCTYGSGKKCP